MSGPVRPRSLSVVIPAYNSAEILPELIERLEAVLLGETTTFEVVLVDDDSSTATWEAIERLSKTRAWIRGIRLMRNYGQHNALLCGIREARYPVVVTMDDDLQHPPEEIPRLLERLEQGYDVVYGTPQHDQHDLWRSLASRLTKRVLQFAMGIEGARDVSAFRAFRTPVREAFAGYRSPFVSIDVLLTWGTTRFASVPVRHARRRYGESHYTIRRLVGHTLNMLTGFSTLPLQLASWVGFGFTVFGFLTLAYVVGRYLIQGTSVPGFPFLASIIAIFSGAQLFALGIIGEYLARMHFRSMERPPYTVRSSTSDEPRI